MRKFWIAAVLFIALICGSRAQQRPNIILIMTDDQQYEQIQFMPNLLALIAQKGTTFNKGYATNALCCPARATILTGQYTHNHLIYGNAPPRGGFDKVYSTGLEQNSINVRLQQAGYRTSWIGKYVNRYTDPSVVPGLPSTYIPPGWNNWETWLSDDQNKGAFNYKLNENGIIKQYGSIASHYLTDVLKAKAVNFINRQTGPFFLVVAPFAPHSPAQPAPRHAQLFLTAKQPRVPSFNEADVSDKPAYIRSLPLLNVVVTNQADLLYRNQLRSLQAVDEMIAAVDDALISKGFSSNTYIFFITDNGTHNGHHRMQYGKKLHYETDIRIPFIVRGPGIPAGASSDLVVSNVDLAPTFAAIAGLSFSSMDGRSLLGLFDGSATEWRTALLLENYSPIPEAQGSPVKLESAGLRDSRYSYVEYYNVASEIEIYDNQVDPHQLNNQAGIINAALFQSRLALLKTCVGQGCRDGER